MRTWRKCGIGAALIFMAAAEMTCTSPKQPKADFDLAVASNGATAFYLLLSPDAWRAVTEHKGLGWTDELLDRRVHAEINTLVEKGLRQKHVDCSRHWLMSEITPIEGGGMLFTGFCASDAELRKAWHADVHWSRET